MNPNIQKIEILCNVTNKKFARHFENHTVDCNEYFYRSLEKQWWFQKIFPHKNQPLGCRKGSLIGGKTAGSTQGLRESKERLCEKEGVVLHGGKKAAGSKESCQSVNVNARIPQYHHTTSAVHFSRTKENESNWASCSTVSARESIQQKDKEASINKCVFR